MPSNDTSSQLSLPTDSQSYSFDPLSFGTEVYLPELVVVTEVIPKIIVAGSRTYKDTIAFNRHLEAQLMCYEAYELVSGCAAGPDRMAIEYCKNDPKCKKIHKFPADWDTHPRAAGFIRNGKMAEVGTKLIAFWDLESKGTEHMVNLATRKNLPTVIIFVRSE